jgi:hypothetical protein
VNSNTLKAIAVVAMFFDHLVTVFSYQDTTLGIVLKCIGRTVAPIMCFFIAEGYYYTSNRKKYIARLFIFAIISHLPYIAALGFTFFQATSVMWALAMGLLALTVIKNAKVHSLLKLLIFIMCCVLSIPANWNFVAVLWIVTFGLFHGNLKYQIAAFCAIGIVFHLIPSYLRFGYPNAEYLHWFQLGIFLAIPFLAVYNGQRGEKSKTLAWGFYLFYPAHLILLFLFNSIISLSNMYNSGC